MALLVLPVEGLPEVRPGTDLAALLDEHADLLDGDVVVVSQKIVSKAEDAMVRPLRGETADAARRRIAREQADRIVADAPQALIVRTRHGFVCANAGIDTSNVSDGLLSLLPEDPDASAARLRDGLAQRGVAVGVIVADTFGRAWRVGQTDVAIGASGLDVLRDERGGADRHGAQLTATMVAVADELAAAADLVRTKASGVPAVVIRGFAVQPSETATAADLVRDPATDLFPRGRGMLAEALLAPWPQVWAGGPDAEDIAAVRRLVASVIVAAQGPPAMLSFDDGLAAGLAAGVLADRGLAVRWHTRSSRVMLEAGRPHTPR